MMATIPDVTQPQLSGLNYIDALLGKGPHWNYVGAGNSISYTFSIASGNQASNNHLQSPISVFSAQQQDGARAALAYLSSVTGIQFIETSDGEVAQLHFANADVVDDYSGWCSWTYRYHYDGNQEITSYTASAYVYLDNVQYARTTSVLTSGYGQELVLHELGHAMGLKHSFDGDIVLPAATDNNEHTLMSYTHIGPNKTAYSEYDLAALKWLYGGDGLGGALGEGTGARWLAGTSVADALTGTAGNDTLEGDGGNDLLNGGDGTDTAYYNGVRSAYAIAQVDAVTWSVTGAEGTDTLTNMEMLRFADMTIPLSLAATASVTGTSANDVLAATAGNNTIDGGAGTDTVAFSGNRANFTVTKSAAGFTVTDDAGNGGTDQLANVERLMFADKMVGLDIDGVGGQAYRLYQAAFNRAPDLKGLGYWISQMDHGASQRDVAASFVASSEFTALYGENPTNFAFLTKLYNNVLQRAPEQAGLDYWLDVMNKGAATRSEVLGFFSEANENKDLVIKIIANGFDYTLWQG
ncbi:hypothetical protein GCM10027277_19540 [Pseudoduganella ginsengisoli]|uniref:DUF4214 domain-containing protein n=1 Tax=Pseudoduganella ginsengisoli TaxID=1462440 RepID=A0A6L6PTH4_9BURK|nr:DUF4214 domain-containing protein [Pseudoduganella ginsengisoli]MTW00790.1 DUF4214 domain-containing protein [Pseudoduganella ginsengisoli]